ncbi:hypothetical protein [Variovorax sp. RA8]|uniref:hypothetical protein n=1 Tax=Variovorax sp. (strain JCM 16519 / RA8) TaxID=662548 RepID=UPI00131777ED|nr:hypothetical protein [Variovorax sp. RA8]VTU44908.1 hypothetical protein RA8P2_00344 [Variovorax sp. RA8]
MPDGFPWVACRAAASLRARAAECGWAELLGRGVDQVGDAACVLFMCLAGCAALVLGAVLLAPVIAVATLVVAVRMGAALVRGARAAAARQATVRKAAP